MPATHRGLPGQLPDGRLDAELPSSYSERPALDEFTKLVQDHELWQAAGRLPDGGPELPRIVVQDMLRGKPRGSRYEFRPAGTVVQTSAADGPVERALQPARLDALRLIVRTELFVLDTDPELEYAYRIEVGDLDPVLIPTSEVASDPNCLAFHAIAQVVIGAF